jgi:hypothetical protein
MNACSRMHTIANEGHGERLVRGLRDSQGFNDRLVKVRHLDMFFFCQLAEKISEPNQR